MVKSKTARTCVNGYGSCVGPDVLVTDPQHQFRCIDDRLRMSKALYAQAVAQERS